MDDVDRVFQFLVRHLSETEPAHLHQPFQLSELYQTFVPYRRFKHELRFDSVEDYEMALLRLLAGVGGYVQLDPADVQEVLALEAEAVSPDTGVFREFAAVRVALSAGAVRASLDIESEYAPPDAHRSRSDTAPPEPPDTPDVEAIHFEASPPVVDEVEEPPEPPSPAAAPGLVFEPVTDVNRCGSCSEELPRGRRASFCPFCGHRLVPGSCPNCGDQLEPDWRFCLACGQPVAG